MRILCCFKSAKACFLERYFVLLCLNKVLANFDLNMLIDKFFKIENFVTLFEESQERGISRAGVYLSKQTPSFLTSILELKVLV